MSDDLPGPRSSATRCKPTTTIGRQDRPRIDPLDGGLPRLFRHRREPAASPDATRRAPRTFRMLMPVFNQLADVELRGRRLETPNCWPAPKTPADRVDHHAARQQTECRHALDGRAGADCSSRLNAAMIKPVYRTNREKAPPAEQVDGAARYRPAHAGEIATADRQPARLKTTAVSRSARRWRSQARPSSRTRVSR